MAEPATINYNDDEEKQRVVFSIHTDWLYGTCDKIFVYALTTKRQLKK